MAQKCVIVRCCDRGSRLPKRANSIPSLPIVGSAHSEAEIEHRKKRGASLVIIGEHEIAKAMLAAILPRAPAAT